MRASGRRASDPPTGRWVVSLSLLDRSAALDGHHRQDAPQPEDPCVPPDAPFRDPILAVVKLVVAVVHNEDAGSLVDSLLDREFRATRLHSSGGLLKQSNATIILGVEDDEVEEGLDIIRHNCTSRTAVVN